MLNTLFPDSRMNSLYMSIGLREFAIAMLGIFIPLYLLKLGYALESVLAFYAALFLAHSLFSLPAGWLWARYGLRPLFLVSTFFLITFYAALYGLEHHRVSILILGGLAGLGKALFWVGYHAYFAEFSQGEGRGKKVGVGDVFRQFKFLGPFVGGVLIASFGFPSLFFVVCTLLFVSCIVVSHHSDGMRRSFDARSIFRRRKVRDILALAGHGVEGSMGSVIWPIILFYSILGSYTALGAITSVSLVFSVVFAFVAGLFTDMNRRFVMRIAALLQSVIWGLRYFVKTAVQVFAVDAAYGIANALIRVPFIAITYDNSDGEILSYSAFRETYINFGSFLLMISLTLVPDLHDSIFAGAGASLFYFFF